MVNINHDSKADDPSVKISDKGQTIDINIGKYIPVQKIQIVKILDIYLTIPTVQNLN